ncbi:cytochrome P450 [Suillus occidentalis]|nr:cytochrome P450 [Suillus occidentalis]
MSSDWRNICVGALVCATLVGVVRYGTEKRKVLPLPPGPRPIPIIGNIRGIAINAPWLAYTEWGKQYGDIVYSHLLCQHIVVINSEKVAIELLGKRSYNYSDRPDLPTNELFGLGFNTILMKYGARWRCQRRIFNQAFRAEAALSYRPMQERKAQQLVRDMLDNPEEFLKHVHAFSSSVIMSASYDYDTKHNDPLVELIGKSLKLAVEELRPEVAAVFIALPILLRLPTWFPGMSIKRKAAQSREWVREWMNDPFQDVLKRTTCSVLQVFILAMQKPTLSSIPSLGASRLPTFSDRPSLQYIDAILRETLRWHPILPLSTPHASVNSDVYEGYYIPKGATIVPNVWAMSRNEQKYPNPSQFLPERFLDAEGNLNDDTVDIAFGFGRRICVGRYFADASLWIAISCLLAKFTFSKQIGADGKAIDFEPQWSNGLAVHPLPFPCSVTPRFSKVDI